MKIESQNKRIIKYLATGKRLTAIEALNKFGCFRLASRVNDLKRLGFDIEKNMITKDGKRFAQYYLLSI